MRPEGWEAITGGCVHGVFCTILVNKKSTCAYHILSVSVQHHPSKMGLCPSEQTNLSVLCSPQLHCVGAAEFWYCKSVSARSWCAEPCRPQKSVLNWFKT